MAVTWREWTDALDRGIKSVPDDDLKEVARMIGESSIILTAGNGGSSSLASHAAQSYMKPCYRAGGGYPAMCLTDAVPTFTAHANDGGWDSALVEVAQPFFKVFSGGLLVLFSSSGRSENIVKLAREAIPRWPVVAFTGFDGGPLRSLATLSIHVDSHDYEVIEPAHDALLHRVQAHLRE